MLDERREYELYLTKDFGGLYKRENIKNGLSGIRHILTILARGFLELCDEEGIFDYKKKDSLTQAFLICWLKGEYPSCELSFGLEEEFFKAKKCCLLDHIVEGAIKIRKAEGTARAQVLKYIEDKITAWEKSMFFSVYENSVNEIYFKAIIADAIHKGPLTRKVLVIKKEQTGFGISADPDALRNIHTLFAVVAVCLQNLPRGQKSATIKMSQLSNQLGRPAYRKKQRDSYLSAVEGYVDHIFFTYKNEPIVYKNEIAGGVVKFILNEKWLNDFDVKLVDCDKKLEANYEVLTSEELFGN